MQFHYSYCFYIHNSYLITKFTLQMVLGMDLPCHPVDFQATQRPRKEHGLRCENSHWILWDQQSADDTDSKSLHTIWYAEYLCSLPKVILRDVRSQSSRRGLRMEADPLSIWMWAWKISGYSSLNHHFSAMHKHQEKVSRKVDCHSSNWVAGLGKQMDGLEY